MAKNRKRSADAARLRQMTKVLLLACVCAAVGLGYVWQKNQIYRLGREIKQREVAVEDAQRRNMVLEARAAQLKSPAALEERVRALNLRLVPPSNSQIVRPGHPAGTAPATVVSTAPPAASANRSQPAPSASTRPRAVTATPSRTTSQRP